MGALIALAREAHERVSEVRVMRNQAQRYASVQESIAWASRLLDGLAASFDGGPKLEALPPDLRRWLGGKPPAARAAVQASVDLHRAVTARLHFERHVIAAALALSAAGIDMSRVDGALRDAYARAASARP